MAGPRSATPQRVEIARGGLSPALPCQGLAFSADVLFIGTTTLHDGSLEINDDIWNSGDSLDIRGGLMHNTTGGGMFNLTGAVSLRGGKLQAFQSAQRGLRIQRYATVFCTGGEVAIAEDGGLLLGASATLPSLLIETSTRIHKDSTSGAYLSVGGDLRIAKGHKFDARGFRVLATFTPSEDQGEFVP